MKNLPMKMEWNQVSDTLWELMSYGLCRGRVIIYAADLNKEKGKYSWSANTGRSINSTAIRGTSDTLQDAQLQVEEHAKKINLPLAFGAVSG